MNAIGAARNIVSHNKGAWDKPQYLHLTNAIIDPDQE